VVSGVNDIVAAVAMVAIAVARCTVLGDAERRWDATLSALFNNLLLDMGM